ncbi:MAG: type II toxin-antitoxin system VapC family toxin [Candidatus Lokiarchaeota archaeon]|nr:type II toxin-antitoxin system VapC family toxin [Candidatus Lokiarchaeota archaeon]
MYLLAIFLDSGFYLGLIHGEDKHHERARDWLQLMKAGTFGQMYTSNFIMAEAATIVASRTKGAPLALEKTRALFAGDLQLATIIHASEPDEDNAWNMFLKLSKSRDIHSSEGVVSFVDCTSIVICQSRDIEFIATFDRHFTPWLRSP